MRILYHHRTQGRGAEGNHIVSIVTALRELGHEVDILSPPGIDPFDNTSTVPVDAQWTHQSGWGSIWKMLSGKMPTLVFELAEIGYNLPAWFKMRAALRARQYDLVLERYASYLVAGAIAARGAGCRFALEVNDVSGVANRVRRQIFPRLCQWFERRLLARCDLTHAVSSYLGDALVERGVPRERVVVAPNGFDLAKIGLSRDREEMRARYGLVGSTVVGFAGWFVDWDRLDFMVEVFAEARLAHPQLKLCLVGDGEPMPKVREMLRARSLEDALVHTGPVPRAEVYDYIRMFDIGLLPHSNLFGSPMIMFEMMGLGVAVIAPRLPPIMDVQADGATGLLFEPLTLRDCVRQLTRLAADTSLRQRIADAALRKLTTEHTWRRTAARILGGLPQTAGPGVDGNNSGAGEERQR